MDNIYQLSDSQDADIYLFSNSIYDQQVDGLIKEIRQLAPRRPNGCLILCTNGGSADAGYRLSRCFKRFYKKFVLYVFGHCKSAGTLVAVAADEIVMSEFGQFGPLDVQLADKDEFCGQTPALDVSQSLATLAESAFNCFTRHFLALEPGRTVSTKTACEIAKSLTLGIIEPIAGQIDPLLLGRVDRSMKIAQAYMERLNPNFTKGERLTGGYPSHGFVIDFEEAKDIFSNVRELTPQEKEIEELLRKWDKVPKQDGWIGLLSRKEHADENNENAANKSNNGESAGSKNADVVPAQSKVGLCTPR